MLRWIVWTAAVCMAIQGRFAPAAESDAAQPTSAPTAIPTPDSPRVSALLLQLGSRDWKERENAADELKQMGPGINAQLSDAYRSAKQFEVRLRIKEVASEIFLGEKFPREKGFIGIALDHVTAGLDPRLAPDEVAIKVMQVIRGTAAERAGMLPGDLIVALNGKPVPRQQTVEQFREQVSSLGPGARIEMQVIRGKQKGTITATLGARPLRLESPNMLERVREAWDGWWTEHYGTPAAAVPQPAP